MAYSNYYCSIVPQVYSEEYFRIASLVTKHILEYCSSFFVDYKGGHTIIRFGGDDVLQHVDDWFDSEKSGILYLFGLSDNFTLNGVTISPSGISGSSNGEHNVIRINDDEQLLFHCFVFLSGFMPERVQASKQADIDVLFENDDFMICKSNIVGSIVYYDDIPLCLCSIGRPFVQTFISFDDVRPYYNIVLKQCNAFENINPLLSIDRYGPDQNVSHRLTKYVESIKNDIMGFINSIKLLDRSEIVDCLYDQAAGIINSGVFTSDDRLCILDGKSQRIYRTYPPLRLEQLPVLYGNLHPDKITGVKYDVAGRFIYVRGTIDDVKELTDREATNIEDLKASTGKKKLTASVTKTATCIDSKSIYDNAYEKYRIDDLRSSNHVYSGGKLDKNKLRQFAGLSFVAHRIGVGGNVIIVFGNNVISSMFPPIEDLITLIASKKEAMDLAVSCVCRVYPNSQLIKTMYTLVNYFGFSADDDVVKLAALYQSEDPVDNDYYNRQIIVDDVFCTFDFGSISEEVKEIKEMCDRVREKYPLINYHSNDCPEIMQHMRIYMEAICNHLNGG